MSWVSGQLRNILALTLAGGVVYLAALGHTEAQQALISAFTVLLGAIWGERAALKIPGKDG